MLNKKMARSLLSTAAVLFAASAFVGCAVVPPELTSAEQAIAKARQDGKDKQCPDEFNAAEKLKNEAVALNTPCNEKRVIALANEALAKTKALCPPRPTPPPPPAPVPPPPAVEAPAPAPAVAVSLSASPASIEHGACSTLTWTSANASSASINQGVGGVELNGSRKVCPERTTVYTIAAVGAGGSREASTTVTVAPKVIDRLALHVNFDFNKATVRKADDADLEKGVAFVKKYPGFKVSLEGHTDSIGGEAYNQRLSEKRAAAVKDYLVKQGVDGTKIQTSGYGKTKPVADNSTAKGRFENRRVEVLILSE